MLRMCYEATTREDHAFDMGDDLCLNRVMHAGTEQSALAIRLGGGAGSHVVFAWLLGVDDL